MKNLENNKPPRLDSVSTVQAAINEIKSTGTIDELKITDPITDDDIEDFQYLLDTIYKNDENARLSIYITPYLNENNMEYLQESINQCSEVGIDIICVDETGQTIGDLTAYIIDSLKYAFLSEDL